MRGKQPAECLTIRGALARTSPPEPTHIPRGSTNARRHRSSRMNLQQALHDLTEALNGTDRVLGQEVRLRAARRVLIMQGIEALEITPSSYPTFPAVIAAAACAPQTPARRRFAALMIHAFTVSHQPVMFVPLSRMRCGMCCSVQDTRSGARLATSVKH